MASATGLAVVLIFVLLVVTGAVGELAVQAGLLQPSAPTPAPKATMRAAVISSVGGRGPAAAASGAPAQPLAGTPAPGSPAALQPAPRDVPGTAASPARGTLSQPTESTGGARPSAGKPSTSAPAVATATASRFASAAPTSAPGGPAAAIQNDLNAINASATALAQQVAAVSPGNSAPAEATVGASDTPIPTAAPPFVPTPSSPG